MKKSKSRFSGLAIFLLMVMILPLTVLSAYAADADRPSSITVECVYDGKPLSGVVFDLYKVADTDASDNLEITDPFSEYSISLDQQTVEGWRNLAQTVAPYALRDNIPAIRQGTTDSSGRVSFSELSTGMYLVYGNRYTNGDFVYIPEPFFISLPSLDNNNELYYDVEANCKGTGYYDPSETTAVKVLKVWDDEGHEAKRPADTVVQLLRDDSIYDAVTLNAENNWRFVWQDLSTDFKWSVVEKDVPDNYTLLIANEGITFVLTNSYKPDLTAVEVEKKWNDKGYENKRPAEIEIQLVKNGQVYDTVALNATGNWTYSWSDLEKSGDWSVREKDVPEGYSSAVTQDGGRFIITNTYTPPLTPYVPTLPKTGQLWWPIPLLIAAGLVCYLIGFLRRTAIKKRDE